jgi:hypothetical protein
VIDSPNWFQIPISMPNPLGYPPPALRDEPMMKF